MGEIFSAAGSIASASIAANAQKEATQMQIDALKAQRDFVYNSLDPSVVGGQARAADVQRAKDRLALQATVDPEALNQRYASEKSITKQLNDLTSGTSNSQKVADQATAEALKPDALAAGKQALIDAALKEIQAGATLPPDLQNELIQSGLEKGGRVTGTAGGGSGLGGNILRTLVGDAGLKLRQQRLEQAKGLLGQASNLEQSRAQILGTLFPNLNTVAQNNLKATQGVLQQSNSMVPEAGLGGTDVANIWLARVGATNQLAQSAADAASRGAMAQAQTWNQGLGQAIGYGAKALPTTSDFFKSAATSSPSDSDISDFVNLGFA